MTAASCLTTIKSIISGSLQQDAYHKLIPVLMPIFNFVFCTDGVDYIEEGADCLNIILYNVDTVPASLWFFFPALCYMLISVKPE